MYRARYISGRPRPPRERRPSPPNPQERRAASLFELSPVAALVTDVEGRVEEANRAAREALGLRPSTSRLRDAVRAVDLDALARHVCRTVASGHARSPLALRRGGRGELVSRLERSVGRPRLHHAWIEDGPAADARPACADAARRVAAVDRRTAAVAHDFGNLLMGIRSCAELASSRLRRGLCPGQALEEIRRASESGRALVKHVLGGASARAESDGGEVDRCEIDVVLGEGRSLLRALLPGRVELIEHPGAAGAQVGLPAEQLQRVITNLALNAADAMPDGGQLTLETFALHDAAQVELRVTDSGCGMDLETKRRALQPFFTTKGAAGGTGLGLASVQEVVGSAGGELSIESARGHGTTVFVRLPDLRRMPPGAAATSGRGEATGEVDQRPGRPERAGRATRARAERRRAGRTVLLVEEDAVTRCSLAELLREEGWAVRTAGSLGEAMRQAMSLPRSRLDALVTDRFVGEDGAEAVLYSVRSIRVVDAAWIASDRRPSEDAELQRALSQFAARFLPKPLDFADLALQLEGRI